MLISVRGLYNFNPTLFDDMELPESVDKDTLTSSIFMECSELETFIPDPDVFKQAITYWSKMNLKNWKRIAETLEAEYNPLWNKDGKITESFEESSDRKLDTAGSSTGSVSAFNTSNFQNQSKQDASGSDSENASRSSTRTRVEAGNIGITTSQHMLTEEVELRRKYNIYDIITEDFKSRFCILVY